MSRPKEFDVDEVLMKAVVLFWRRGYEATSVRDLVDHMGIGRSSLYATFGDKHALFIRALRRYDQTFRVEAAAELARAAASPRQTILGIFREASAAVLEGGSTDGCLLVNTALEMSPHDRESEEIVRRAFTGIEGFFRATIERGQASGEIDRALSATDTARGLLALLLGLRVLARSRPEEALLRSIENQADALLR